MKLTKTWLLDNDACSEGTRWFLNQSETNSNKVLDKLISEDRLDWANWLITRLMTHKQQIKYAVYAAEQVLAIYERNYPNDIRPRKAIEVAKSVVKRNTKETRKAAKSAAAYAAKAAVYAAHAAYDTAANYTANAASAAAYAAYDTATATYAAYAAYAANAATSKEMNIRILNYGQLLLANTNKKAGVLNGK